MASSTSSSGIRVCRLHKLGDEPGSRLGSVQTWWVGYRAAISPLRLASKQCTLPVPPHKLGTAARTTRNVHQALSV